MGSYGRDGDRTWSIVGTQWSVAHVRRSDTSPFTFATGVLTLDGVPLSVAIAELDRWYDADIRFGDPTLAMQTIKGEFGAGSIAELGNRYWNSQGKVFVLVRDLGGFSLYSER